MLQTSSPIPAKVDRPPTISTPSRKSTDRIETLFSFFRYTIPIPLPGLVQDSVDSLDRVAVLKPNPRSSSSWNLVVNTLTFPHSSLLLYFCSLRPSWSASKTLAYSRGVKRERRPFAFMVCRVSRGLRGASSRDARSGRDAMRRDAIDRPTLRQAGTSVRLSPSSVGSWSVPSCAARGTSSRCSHGSPVWRGIDLNLSVRRKRQRLALSSEWVFLLSP